MKGIQPVKTAINFQTLRNKNKYCIIVELFPMAGTWYVSVPAISSSLATLRVQIGPWTTVEPSEPAWPHPKSLELAIWSTMLDLALDSEVRPSNSQYWPGNCLLSGTETMCVEGSHRNGNNCHQTSYTMMMTIIPNGTFLWPRQKVWIDS